MTKVITQKERDEQVISLKRNYQFKNQLARLQTLLPDECSKLLAFYALSIGKEKCARMSYQYIQFYTGLNYSQIVRANILLKSLGVIRWTSREKMNVYRVSSEAVNAIVRKFDDLWLIYKDAEASIDRLTADELRIHIQEKVLELFTDVETAVLTPETLVKVKETQLYSEYDFLDLSNAPAGVIARLSMLVVEIQSLVKQKQLVKQKMVAACQSA